MTYPGTKRYPKGTLCSIEGCEKPVKAKGFCTTHYQRFRQGKAVEAPIRQVSRWHAIYDVFNSRIEKTDHGLLWIGNLNENGYGRLNNQYAHRVAWELAYGSIPEGMELDHNPDCPKRCVTVHHLTLKEKAQHTADGWERGELDGGWSTRARTWKKKSPDKGAQGQDVKNTGLGLTSEVI